MKQKACLNKGKTASKGEKRGWLYQHGMCLIRHHQNSRKLRVAGRVRENPDAGKILNEKRDDIMQASSPTNYDQTE